MFQALHKKLLCPIIARRVPQVPITLPTHDASKDMRRSSCGLLYIHTSGACQGVYGLDHSALPGAREFPITDVD